MSENKTLHKAWDVFNIEQRRKRYSDKLYTAIFDQDDKAVEAKIKSELMRNMSELSDIVDAYRNYVKKGFKFYNYDFISAIKNQVEKEIEAEDKDDHQE